MLRVFEAFAGYGSQRMALRNLGIEHEVVAISEFDKYADASYQAIHGETWNMGDITKIDVDDVPDHDLFTYSFPCQDISVAGKGKGFSKDSGTRSGLLWESERIIKAKKPKYLLMENVKNLIGKKFMPGFQEWILALEELGYSNYWEVLNAKDFGIPQNRERVFMVSILGEHKPYVFPKPIKLEKRLKDVLEDEVDEKYYLSKKIQDRLTVKLNMDNEIKTIGSTKGKDNTRLGQRDVVYSSKGIMGALSATDYKQPKQIGEPEIKQVLQYNSENRENTQRYRTYDPSGVAPTLNTMQGGGLHPHIPEPVIAASRGRNPRNPSDRTAGALTEQRLEVNKDGISNTLTTVQKDNYVVEGIPIKNATEQGYLLAKDGDGVDLAYPTSNTRRGRVQESMSQTLTTDDSKGVVELTAKEGEPTIVDAIYNNREPRVYDEYAPTLRSERHGLDVVNNYRIRKLTPLECFRLMDVTDEDFYKAQAVNSNSQLYKQAGNSIVVSVLEAIFRNMFLEVPDEDLIGEHISLF